VPFRKQSFLLYSYIASELLGPVFASFLILYSIFFLVKLAPLLDVVLKLKIGAADFIRIFAYIFPHMLLYIIPLASMMGVIICFMRMTDDREILAFKSCGISIIRLQPPVFITALCISLITGFFSIKLIPAGEISMKKLMIHLAITKIDKGLEKKQFSDALGKIILYIDEIDKKTGRWNGVYVSDQRDRRQPLITVARTGYMDSEPERMRVNIVLNNGSMHSAEGSANQVIDFEQYRLHVPLTPPTIIGGTDIARLSRSAMSQERLLQAAEQIGPETRQGKRYIAEYYKRITLPAGCLILSLLGMPLGLLSQPGRKAIGVPAGLGFFILYYVMLTFAESYIEQSPAKNIWLIMWMPNITFALFTAYFFQRTVVEKKVIPRWLQQLFFFMFNKILLPVSRQLIRTKNVSVPTSNEEIKENDAGEEILIHANSLSRVYHFPECEFYNSELCTIHLKSREIAEQKGFKQCRFCLKHAR